MKPSLRSFSLHSFPMLCMMDASTSTAGKCVEGNVKVCNICGDIGFEEALITCCTCDEGAEHFYCVSALNSAFSFHKRNGGSLDSFSKSFIQCEGCKLKAEKRKLKNVQNLIRSQVASKAPYTSLKRLQNVRDYNHFRSSHLLGNAKGSSSRKRNFETPPYHRFSAERHLADHAKARENIGTPWTEARSIGARSTEWTRKHSSRTPHSGKVKFISPRAMCRERTGLIERMSAIADNVFCGRDINLLKTTYTESP